MKTCPLRPGTCLWVIGLFVWPALFELTAADGRALLVERTVLPIVITDEPGDIRSDLHEKTAPVAPLRPYDEGFVILPPSED